ncbi:lysozyme C, milk isozyme-like [Mustelus asterias]
MKTLLILSTLLMTANSKIFERCELVRLFKNNGLDGYEGYSLNNYVCTAFYESAYNSAALRLEWAKGKVLSMDCGMFQINNFWWCLGADTPVSKMNCGTSCSAFLDDDLTDDINCVKSIVKLHPGMSAWVAWNLRCKGKSLEHFVSGCGI